MARPKWRPFLIPTKKPLNAYNLILGRSELERMRAGTDVLQVNVAWPTISPLFASRDGLRKAKMHFCGGGESFAKSGLKNAAKPALRDTAGKPPLFFWCRGQHPEVLSQRSGADRSKRAPGEESSS
jgi:hypothetical protein